MNHKLQAQLDQLIPLARANLERDGHLLPVAFIFTRDYTGGEIVGCPWHDNEEKEQAIIVLRERCRDMDACAIAMLNEAWQANIPDGKWDGTPASQMPDKKEVVILYVEELDGCWRGTADITRANGRPTFGEIEWQPMQERASFERFQKLLA